MPVGSDLSVVTKESKSSQNGWNICRKKAQKTQSGMGLFVHFEPLSPSRI
jgi:hypothetical protein